MMDKLMEAALIDCKKAIADFEAFKAHGYSAGHLPASWSFEVAIAAMVDWIENAEAQHERV